MPIDSAASRHSYRVEFAGGRGHRLAGIVDAPLDTTKAGPHEAGLHEPRGASPVVLFSHCFTCNKDLKAAVRISRHLSARGITVLRYDMTGLGGSGGRFVETNVSSNVADLLAAARFATESLGAPAALIGHSLGGAASMAAAADWPSDAPPLMGVATVAAPSDTVHLAELLIRMDRRVESEGRGEVTIGGRQWETSPQLIEDLRTFDLPARIARLRVPVLMFHSPVDETVGFEHALRILSWVTASLVVLPEADHLLVRNPADISYVGDTLAAWLHRYCRR